MIRCRRAPLLAMLLLAVAPSIAQPPSIVARWQGTDPPPRPVKKVGVLAITGDRQIRHRVEDKLVSHLLGRGVEGVTSYPLVPDLDASMSPQEIVRRILEQKIEAVIGVRLVPLSRKEESDWSDAWRGELERPRLLRDLVEESLPLLDDESKTWVVEVSLWDVQTRRRTWAAHSGVTTLKSMRKKGVGDFVQQVITALGDARVF